jgi:hypothetical protein
MRVVPIARTHPIVGVWRPAGDERTAEWTIAANGDAFRVSAIDRYDGEAFVVSDVSWDGETLRFTSLMPSTQWEVGHAFRLVAPDEVDQERTRREVFVRSPDLRIAAPERAGETLLGGWRSEDEDGLAILVRRAGSGFDVSVKDRRDGEAFDVSDVRRDGTALRFRSVVPSTGERLEHSLRALDARRAEHAYTEHDRCFRVRG